MAICWDRLPGWVAVYGWDRILARLLSPEAFGVVGMALITIGLGKLIGDLGFGAAIIQRPDVTQKHIRTAFTGSTMVSGLLFVLLWLLTPKITSYVHAGRLDTYSSHHGALTHLLWNEHNPGLYATT